ncbi:conserved uncharacterized protein [Desulfococcus multivorans]|nr:conserved uncharacterized protein [Desulfococcus multivorans]
MIESLKRRKKTPLPEVGMTATAAWIRLNKDMLQLIVDDFFAVEEVEILSGSKWSNRDPKCIKEIEVEKDGKRKKEKRFVYDKLQPKGDFLQVFYPDGDGIWVKLWRDMLWNILRGIPKTRTVYEERFDGKPSSEGKKLWAAFQKESQNRKKGKIRTEKLSSSLFLGAEADNPEKVSFVGAIEDNFLLNFWPIVSLIFVPRELKIERSDDRLRIAHNNESGYVLAIPEPCELDAFLEEAAEMLSRLESEPAGFRPRAARIDVFEEGGLEYLYHFARKQADDKGAYTLSLHHIEIYHVQRQGKRIRQLSADRVLPKMGVISDYEIMRKRIKNPFYKKIYLSNLLTGQLWHMDAEKVFHNEPMPLFIYSEKTPKEVRFFGKDVKDKFLAIRKTLEHKKGAKLMTEKDHDDQLTLRVYRLIQTYVRRKTEEKSGKKYDSFRNHKDEKDHVIYPREYREALAKVSTDVFLAMRGRREQDFIEYFTGTVCSVPQYLPENEYLSVAKDLMENWQKIKTLSMLAISATSYLSEPSKEKEE